MTTFVKVHALSLATTMAIAFVFCAIYDLLFPPYGLLTAMKSISPLPLSGSAIGFLTGLLFFAVAGLRSVAYTELLRNSGTSGCGKALLCASRRRSVTQRLDCSSRRGPSRWAARIKMIGNIWPSPPSPDFLDFGSYLKD